MASVRTGISGCRPVKRQHEWVQTKNRLQCWSMCQVSWTPLLLGRFLANEPTSVLTARHLWASKHGLTPFPVATESRDTLGVLEEEWCKVHLRASGEWKQTATSNGVNGMRGVEWDVRAHRGEQQVGMIVVTTGSMYSKRLNGTNSQLPSSSRQPHPAQFWEIDFTNPWWIFKWATEVIA